MAKVNVGFLHPGSMGVSLATSAQNSGNTAIWASAGRSAATRKRALQHNLTDAGTLDELCATCSIIVSICPPHAAEAVATQVLDCGFRGLFVDANAISVGRTRRIAAQIEGAGAHFADGSVIGGPAWEPGRTWLYLAGESAAEVAKCFSAGPLETEVLGDEIGQAAALKMCFAAYTKGTTALLAGILATAEATGVREALESQWSRGGSAFAEQTRDRVRGVTAKAWRFAGELDEIGATFDDAGVPSGFQEAAAEIYRRLAHFKDTDGMPALDEVLAAILRAE